MVLEDKISVGLKGVDIGLLFVSFGKEIALWKKGFKLVWAKVKVG